MKNILFLIACHLTFVSSAQQHACSKAKQNAFPRYVNAQARTASPNSLISHEIKYDVKFVHLNLNLERNTKYVSGNVKTVATVVASVLDTFMTLLHQNHTIDSIRFNGLLLPAIRVDSTVKVKIPVALNSGASFTVQIYYKGTPPTGGSAIGSGFSTGVSGAYNTQCTWSLSEALVAYHWWPCKQNLRDKIDSSWVYVTTDSTNKVGSNGLLKNVVTIGNKKRYEWKSTYPIDYYLISVAVSKYKEYNLYAKPQYMINDSILIQNYVYENAFASTNWNNTQKADLNKIPQVMKLFCNLFGMYPFHKEKYGHCMAPFGGGMEHQTMTSIGYFDYYVNAHELGHQWWGDNVTCKTWGDIWINEGFASYTEHLTAQYLDFPNFALNLNSDHNNVMSLPGGSVFFTNQDTMNSGVIFDGRLTYAKGGSIIRTLQFITNNDSVWFNTLRGFQNTYKNSTASVVDFKNYYEAQTNINATQFFSQWYYGEGYPTFNVKFNNLQGNVCVLSSTQTVSAPNATPLFITPIEYKIRRTGFPDTTVRVMHTNPIEMYSFNARGPVTGIVCDPNNWLINKAITGGIDTTLTNGLAVLSPVVSNIQIGPNPSFGIFNVINPANVLGTAMVWNLEGKLLFEKKLSGNTVIDLTRYAHGLYEIKIYNDEKKEVLSQKLISE